MVSMYVWDCSPRNASTGQEHPAHRQITSSLLTLLSAQVYVVKPKRLAGCVPETKSMQAGEQQLGCSKNELLRTSGGGATSAF